MADPKRKPLTPADIDAMVKAFNKKYDRKMAKWWAETFDELIAELEAKGLEIQAEEEMDDTLREILDEETDMDEPEWGEPRG